MSRALSAPSAPTPRVSRRRQKWDDADRDTLRSMHAAGASRARMAERLGRTETAVSDQMCRLGLVATPPCPPWTGAEAAELERLWRLGTPERAIAEALGRSRAYIQKRLVVLKAAPTPAVTAAAKPIPPAPQRVDTLYRAWSAANQRVRERQLATRRSERARDQAGARR